MRTYLSFLLASCLCVVAGSCSHSDRQGSEQLESPATKSPAPRAPTATEILQTTSHRYAEIQSFRVDVVETMSLDRSGTRDITADRWSATLARPNRISLPGANAKSLSFHSDGRQLWTVLGDRFSLEACPDSMSLIADDPLRSSLLQSSNRFLLGLLSDDAQVAMTRDVESVTVLEDEVLDGQLTRHLQFIHPEFDWEMWVAVDEPRLIYQVVYDMSKQLGVGLSETDDARITTTIRFENWQTNPPLSEAAFAYRPAVDAQQVDHVMGVSR